MAGASLGFALAIGLFVTLLYFVEERKNKPNSNRLVPIRVRVDSRNKRRQGPAPEMEEEGYSLQNVEWFVLAIFMLFVFGLIGLQL